MTTDDVTRWQELFGRGSRAFLAFAWTVPNSSQETVQTRDNLPRKRTSATRRALSRVRLAYETDRLR